MIRDREGLGWIGRLIALVVLAAVFLGVYSYFFAPHLPAPYAAPTANTDDFVEIDYIGTFRVGGEDVVFDTSIEAVAKDNASWPKAVSFNYRIGGGAYKPLQFTMGCGSDSPTCPLDSFQDGIRGMKVGDARNLVLTPDQAYGYPDPSLVYVRPLVEEIPVTVTTNATEFKETFYLEAMDGMVTRDPVWNWNVTVRVSGDIVTYRRSPDLHEVVRIAQTWDAEVVEIDDSANGGVGVIRLRHLLTADDAYAFQAKDAKGQFIIVEVNQDAGTYTLDYNREVDGKTLTFQVTLKGLRKGSP